MSEQIKDYNNLDNQFNDILATVIKNFYLQETNQTT
jgi:hypothetical protein